MNNNEINEFFGKLTKDEVRFCEEVLEADKNEHGVYVYESTNTKSKINLVLVLQHYKEWLQDENILKSL